jgi:rare lipoprotein A
MVSFTRFFFGIPRAVFVLAPLALFLAAPPHVDAFGPKRYHDAEVEHGRASWYGDAQGHRTSSGERFDEEDLTAAMRHVPFGTIVRVTNEHNGRSVQVRINDRGPWTGGRLIDVSSAAADILQMKRDGVVPVTVEIVELGSPGQRGT